MIDRDLFDAVARKTGEGPTRSPAVALPSAASTDHRPRPPGTQADLAGEIGAPTES